MSRYSIQVGQALDARIYTRSKGVGACVNVAMRPQESPIGRHKRPHESWLLWFVLTGFVTTIIIVASLFSKISTPLTPGHRHKRCAGSERLNAPRSSAFLRVPPRSGALWGKRAPERSVALGRWVRSDRGGWGRRGSHIQILAAL